GGGWLASASCPWGGGSGRPAVAHIIAPPRKRSTSPVSRSVPEFARHTMKALPLIAIAALLAGASRAAAAPAFTCTGAAAEEFETVCADSEIIRLDRAVDAALRRRLAGADPLTATLLKRDQRWFNDTLDGHNIGAFGDPANETRQRMIAALEARLAAIGRLGSEVVRTPAGEWANAFGTAKVEDLG